MNDSNGVVGNYCAICRNHGRHNTSEHDELPSLYDFIAKPSRWRRMLQRITGRP